MSLVRNEPFVVRPRPASIILVLAALLSCQTTAQKKAAENAEINRRAAAEIARICALQGAEREAELKKIKAASGMDLYCPGS